jgi:hypothetical protein
MTVRDSTLALARKNPVHLTVHLTARAGSTKAACSAANCRIMAELVSRNPLPACKHDSILTTVGSTPLI